MPSPHAKSSTSGAKIVIIFDPNKSTKVKTCKQIVHIQFIRGRLNGKIVKPSTLTRDFSYRKRDEFVATNGWYVDHSPGDASHKTPSYQHGYSTKDSRHQIGSKTASKTKPAKMTDLPTWPYQGDLDYDAKDKPKGRREIRYEFATFAWCFEGADCGQFYEGISWKWVKTWRDDRAKKPGKATITDRNVKMPTKEMMEAFKKFNKIKDFVPCKVVKQKAQPPKK